MTRSSLYSTKRVLLSKEYAARHFPEFVIKVAKELKLADERAKDDSKEFIKAYFEIRKAEDDKNRKEIEKSTRESERWKDIHSGTIIVAELANQGLTKQQIYNQTGLKISTIRHYLQNARREGLIPKKLIVPGK